MNEARSHSPIRKLLVFGWYLPPILILAAGLFFSVVGTPSIPSVTSENKVFAEGKKATASFTEMDRSTYSFSVKLNEDFAFYGENVSQVGSFRKGGFAQAPLTLKASSGKISAARVHVATPPGEKPILRGFNLSIRECPTPWIPVNNGFSCKGSNTVITPAGPIDGDPFPLLKKGQSVPAGGSVYLLATLGKERNLILPLAGYDTKLVFVLEAIQGRTM